MIHQHKIWNRNGNLFNKKQMGISDLTADDQWPDCSKNLTFGFFTRK